MTKDEAGQILRSARWQYSPISGDGDPRPRAFVFPQGVRLEDFSMALKAAELPEPGLEDTVGPIQIRRDDKGYVILPERPPATVSAFGGPKPVGSSYTIVGVNNLDYLTQELGVDIPRYAPPYEQIIIPPPTQSLA